MYVIQLFYIIAGLNVYIINCNFQSSQSVFWELYLLNVVNPHFSDATPIITYFNLDISLFRVVTASLVLPVHGNSEDESFDLLTLPSKDNQKRRWTVSNGIKKTRHEDRSPFV